MAKIHTTLFAGMLLTSVSAFALQAQEAPGFLADTPADQVGDIQGVPVWQVGDTDLAWIVLPNGAGIVAGYVFDHAGNDIGSPLMDMPAVDVWESFSFPRPEPVTGAFTSDADQEDLLRETLSMAETVIAGRAEDEQQALLIDLVQRMDAAESPEEFVMAINAWRSDMDAGHSGVTPEPLTGIGAAPGGERPGIVANADGFISLDDAAITPPWQASDEVQPVQVQETPEQRLFDTISNDGAWFSIGADNAPVVYMIADPACPYCARAIQTLQSQVSEGNMQIRILLAPFVSQRSAGMIAGILLSDNPASAYWDHSLAYAARGASSLQMREFSELPDTHSARIRDNYEIVVDNEIPGVPFFAWMTQSGPEFVSGVAQPSRFSGALSR